MIVWLDTFLIGRYRRHERDITKNLFSWHMLRLCIDEHWQLARVISNISRSAVFVPPFGKQNLLRGRPPAGPMASSFIIQKEA
jgi:hypothetical protein